MTPTVPDHHAAPAASAVPDSTGHFGRYGGRFVPEALVAAIDDLTAAFHETQADPAFRAELDRLQRDYTGRPSPLTDAPKFGEHAGGARILLKREDLNHTGSHKINNVLERCGRLPDAVAACVGGGSNAIGIFTAFVPDADVRLVGFEAGGDGIETGRHAASITGGLPGVLHGARSYLLQDENGQTIESHSISAGLDYPGVGPEHSYLSDIGRAVYRPITDTEAMEAFSLLSRSEGIIPAIESAHALAGAMKLGRELGPESIILVNLSGR